MVDADSSSDEMVFCTGVRYAETSTGGLIMKRRYCRILLVGVLALVSGSCPQAQDAPRAAPPREDCAKVWLADPAGFEEFLRTAPIERVAEVPVGVSKPKRIYFAKGGVAESAVW